MFLKYDALEQLEFKLEKNIGIQKHAGKVSIRSTGEFFAGLLLYTCWSDFISHFATLIVNLKNRFNSLIHCSCIPKQPYQSYDKKRKHPKLFKHGVKDKDSEMGQKLIIEDLNYI